MPKIIKISATPEAVFALCEDGTLWVLDRVTRKWQLLPEIPTNAR